MGFACGFSDEIQGNATRHNVLSFLTENARPEHVSYGQLPNGCFITFSPERSFFHLYGFG